MIPFARPSSSPVPPSVTVRFPEPVLGFGESVYVAPATREPDKVLIVIVPLKAALPLPLLCKLPIDCKLLVKFDGELLLDVEFGPVEPVLED